MWFNCANLQLIEIKEHKHFSTFIGGFVYKHLNSKVENHLELLSN
jgi:hypothetical protein